MSKRELKLTKPELAAIYSKIGSPEKLYQILLDFYQRMSKDILLDYFFANKDLNSIAQKQTEFLLKAMGAAPSYTGKPPAKAHDALPKILKGHFDRRLRLLEETLRDHGIHERDIQTWINFENAFRDVIISD